MNIAYLLKPKDSVAWINKNSTIRQGLEKFNAHGYTAMPVLNDDGSYFGTVTEGDFLWYMINNPDREKYEQVSIQPLIRKSRNATVSISADMEMLFDRIIEQNFVPVVDDRNKFIGIVTRHAFMEYLRKMRNS